MPIDKAVTLARPVEPGSLVQDNIGTAIADLLGLAEFATASFLVMATDVFGRSEDFSPQSDPFSPRQVLAMAFDSHGLARIAVTARQHSETGDPTVMASLLLDFVECRATAIVKPRSGLEEMDAQFLAKRMVARFPYRDFVGGTRDAEAEKLKAEVARIRDEARTELVEVRSANEEAKQLLEGQRATVQESTIRYHAQVFKDEASDHGWIAGVCLAVAGFTALGLVGVALTFVSQDASLRSFSEQAFTLHILERVTLISILATIVGVSVRLLRASLHNWVVATHRSNALQAYEAFAAATKDKRGAGELLAQALAMTFAPKDTGYSKASGAPDASQIFTEIVKRTLGGKAG